MFSLFQDRDGSSLVNSSTNDAPLTSSELSSRGNDSRIVLQLDPKSPPKPSKQQASWCNQVLKLKKDLQEPNKVTAASPFQHFHSKRGVTKAAGEESLVTSEKTTFNTSKVIDSSSIDCVAHAVLVTEISEETNGLPEIRRVRFLRPPSNVDHEESGANVKSGRKVSKRVYWTRHEVDCIKKAAVESAKTFRSERPAAVKRLIQIFEEFCWKYSNDNDDSADSVDEEAEEMLHRFLIDWGMSSVRGLEERVVPRKVFDQDRRLAQESVLAYQQMLRESGVYTPKEMEAMLSARSESASRKARMFAMYMALGDALAVAAFQSDEIYGSDEDSITFA